MDILLVEDDEFKAADLSRTIEDVISDAKIVRAASVTSALRSVSARKFDLIILDMSLPTFDLSGPGGGGSPQGQGGLEVLRLLRRLDSTSPVVVVTQYPDIEIDGLEVPLDNAAGRLSARFRIEVRACVPYGFDSEEWRAQFAATLHS